ncbi:UNVERIFIED_CONTAM: hypothetical protein Sradi_4642900 [Sesamum radiatum]|uniref:Uncharacterized protein n=1 Tax=Sesamum radiatum TaxID=300843 RepID=A0AAW2NFL6_SESRA
MPWVVGRGRVAVATGTARRTEAQRLKRGSSAGAAGSSAGSGAGLRRKRRGAAGGGAVKG